MDKPEQESKNRLVNILISLMIPGILLSLFLLWPGMTDEADFTIPIEVSGLEEKLIVSGLSSRTILVSVKGHSKKIKSVTPSCSLDLTGVSRGSKTLTLTPDMFSLPEGFELVGINPESITLTIENKSVKQLPVIIKHSGTPARGFRIAGVLSVPEAVTVSGPESLMETIDEIITKPVDIAGFSESVRKEVVPDINKDLTVIIPETPILADISITDKIVSKKMTVQVQGKNGRIEITPDRADIEISGPENKFSAIEKNKNISITIDAKKLKPGIYVRRAAVNLPVDFTLVSVQPELFTVKVN